MSFAMKCDRCGIFYGSGVQLHVCVDNSYYVDDGELYDLCPDCMREFENWLHNGKHIKDDITTTQDEGK